jgi:hypothetical protein
MSSRPKERPPSTAHRVAFMRSPVTPHAIARKTRPPSSGKPGIRLKIASTRLMSARYSATSITGAPRSRLPASRPSNAKSPAIMRLARGPTPAISSSSRGESGSRRMRAIPPKMKRVMPSTGMPFARDTRACESSCARSEEKKSSVPARPMTMYVERGRSGSACGKTASASDQKTRKKITSQERSTRISKPSTEPRRSPVGAGAGLARSPSVICWALARGGCRMGA